MLQQIQKIVVGAAIVEDGRILIVKRSRNDKFLPGMWELPGGGVEFKESAEDALIREIDEETDLKIEYAIPYSTFQYLNTKKDKIEHTIQINFYTKVQNPIVNLSDEHDDFAWIRREEIRNYEITPEVRTIIEEATDENNMNQLERIVKSKNYK